MALATAFQVSELQLQSDGAAWSRAGRGRRTRRIYLIVTLCGDLYVSCVPPLIPPQPSLQSACALFKRPQLAALQLPTSPQERHSSGSGTRSSAMLLEAAAKGASQAPRRSESVSRVRPACLKLW